MAKRLLLILMLFVIADAYFFQAFTTIIHTPFLHKIYWYLDVLLLIGVFTLIFSGNRVKIFSDWRQVWSLLFNCIYPKIAGLSNLIG
ncbi:hypothetical protein KUH03_42325 [Sphingobacterium sp. E70]|uniref:hypothetical protein n=1 Tax=Sphingobacterium sp. E70 TaxID=2853439 RepID=UPI00211C040E|nr:hypothetical protein [Sphingobacterium sp. E70]ULT25350.1 hypothetical protein KUH03_42325 [Sphingobacterium sp. E70]